MSDWKDDTFDLNNPAYGLFPDAKTHVFRPSLRGYWSVSDGHTTRYILANSQQEALQEFLASTDLTPSLVRPDTTVTPADRELLASMGIKAEP